MDLMKSRLEKYESLPTGKLKTKLIMTWLYRSMGLPLAEFKSLMKNALVSTPEDRYSSIQKKLQRRRNYRNYQTIGKYDNRQVYVRDKPWTMCPTGKH